MGFHVMVVREGGRGTIAAREPECRHHSRETFPIHGSRTDETRARAKFYFAKCGGGRKDGADGRAGAFKKAEIKLALGGAFDRVANLIFEKIILWHAFVN